MATVQSQAETLLANHGWEFNGKYWKHANAGNYHIFVTRCGISKGRSKANKYKFATYESFENYLKTVKLS